jgi:hypothetical protein
MLFRMRLSIAFTTPAFLVDTLLLATYALLCFAFLHEKPELLRHCIHNVALIAMLLSYVYYRRT